MLGFNKINSSMYGATPMQSGDVAEPTAAQIAANPEQMHIADTESETAPFLDAETFSDHQAGSPQRRDGLQRLRRALLKPLIALAAAQYVLVAALVGLTAVAVASEAGKFVNAKLTPIIVALKRL